MTGSGVVVLEHIPSLSATRPEGINELALYGVLKSEKGSDDFVQDTYDRAMHIGQRLVRIADAHKPDYVVFETPSLASKGNATRTLPMLLGSLLTQLSNTLSREGVKLVTVPPTSLKKFATGKGNATKDQMVEAIEAKEPEFYKELVDKPKSKGRYDLADAFWLSQWVLHYHILERE